MSLAKLDRYNYYILPGVIRIQLEAIHDPIAVDIMSEISAADNHIYVESRYFLFEGDMEIYKHDDIVYLELLVTQIVQPLEV